jgi:selenocysteine-specific elongation factor
MIIATAGHVDHGKTSLIKALTGVDADRLPEEKKRGLTIDLGFVYDDRICPGKVIGFVDVPGHERFIHNMLAGVTAIEAAMLIVAADDGPMPQTREHLDILDLVGVNRGFVALTKADLVSEDQLLLVMEEIEEMLDGTTLAGSEIFPVSSTTGDGVADIAGHLNALAETREAQLADGNFRLAVDRAFNVAGAGLVVTGLVHAGGINTGATAVVTPAGESVRIRGLRVQDRTADSARQGDRCAINLAGLSKDDIRRGDWVVADRAHITSRRLDAKIRVLASEARSLKHWTPAHIHVGTSDVTGRVALLEGKAIEPGDTGLVQLVLDTPVAAGADDVVIVRDQSAQRTVGGGRVVDPFSPNRGRARLERLAWLHALILPDRSDALAAVLEASPRGTPLHLLETIWNLTADEAAELWAQVDVRCAADGALYGVTQARFDALCSDIVTALDAWHKAKPDSGGSNAAALMNTLPERVQRPVFDHAVAHLVETGELMRAGPLLHRPGHAARLTGMDDKLWHEARAIMHAAEEKPPTVFELSEELGQDKKKVGKLLGQAAKVGLVMRVSANRFMTTAILLELADVAEREAAKLPGGKFAVAAYRDWSGMGRNLSIEILEFFDKVGFTRRIGNEREILKPAAAVFGGTGDATNSSNNSSTGRAGT